MKKHLWLLLLLTPFLFAGSIQQKQIAVIGQKNAAGGGCTTDNDSAIVSHNVATSADDPITINSIKAEQFTIGAETTVTEYITEVHDDGQSGQLVVEIWSNNATPNPDEPDPAGLVHADTTVSVDHSQIDDASNEFQAFTLAAPYVLSAGTYWIVWRGTGSSPDFEVRYAADAGSLLSASSDAGSAWTSTADWQYNVVIWGCQ